MYVGSPISMKCILLKSNFQLVFIMIRTWHKTAGMYAGNHNKLRLHQKIKRCYIQGTCNKIKAVVILLIVKGC
jgi:tRNA splicing ligase